MGCCVCLQSALSQEGSDTMSDDSDAESSHSGMTSGILDKHGHYDSAEYWDQPESSEGRPSASLHHFSLSSASQADGSAQQLQQEVPTFADMQSPSGTIHWLESAPESVSNLEHVTSTFLLCAKLGMLPGCEALSKAEGSATILP